MRSPVIFALLLAVVPGLAHAGFDEEKSQCLAGDEVPAVVINSCTQILETGDLDDTDLAVAYTNRGWAFAQSGLVEQGTEDFGKAIRHKPNFAKPYQLRGAYRLVNGEFKKAIQDLVIWN